MFKLKIGASKAFVFDLTAACSGFVFALGDWLKSIFALASTQRGIVIGSETLSKVIDWEDRTTAVLFGDGAGGVLLESFRATNFFSRKSVFQRSRGEVLQSSSAWFIFTIF